MINLTPYSYRDFNAHRSFIKGFYAFFAEIRRGAGSSIGRLNNAMPLMKGLPHAGTDHENINAFLNIIRKGVYHLIFSKNILKE